MDINSQQEFEKRWQQRIEAANRYYNSWEKRFKCENLEKYYEGFHWENIPDNYNPYTINEFYGIIKVKVAHYLFGRPHFQITPTPGNADWNFDIASGSSQLKQDVLNSIIKNPNAKFKEEIKLAFLDSIFRFGIMEVGYGADWIRNPRAGKPLLVSSQQEVIDYRKNKVLREPDELPANEQIYFKRIHAKRFRIGGVDAEYLERCNWVGYFDYVYRDDLLAFPNLKNKNRLSDVIPSRTDDYTDFAEFGNDQDALKCGDVAKIWHIWDLRAKKRFLFSDQNFVELHSENYKRLPLIDYRWDFRTHGWYPIPPAFQWISPQDEINEAREQLRSHRRRFTRKYQVVEGAIDEGELEKFEKGVDGSLVKVRKEGAITPVQDANLGSSIDAAFATSSEDLKKVSGTASEMVRGDRQTATETMVVQQRASIREDYESSDVQDWMCRIGREALLLMSEKFALGTWAEITCDPTTEGFLGEVQENMPNYKWVTSEDLKDGFDFRIQVDIVSLSPIKAEEEKQKFLGFLQALTQSPMIALSPLLIKETAYRFGYRNERVIQEFQRMALLQMMGMNGMVAAGGNAPPPMVGNAKAPPIDQNIRQIQGQV